MASTDIVVAEDVWGSAFDSLAKKHSIHADAELWSDRTGLCEALREARALVVRNRTAVDGDLLRHAPRLQLVARAGVGLDNIDLSAAAERGVTVVSPRGANARSVAEYTIGAALALLRDLVGNDTAVKTGTWERHAGRELAGRTWGIVGAGSTGLAVARLARALGMSVLGYDPYLDTSHSEIADSGIELISLEALCQRSDAVSIHLPAAPDTQGLFDRRLLSRMKASAVLINAGRGEVVDEDALADALEAHRLGGAALDVRASEPPIVGRLERLENILLTPHIAGITVESQRRITQALADDIESVLAGGVARYAVLMPVRPSSQVHEVLP